MTCNPSKNWSYRTFYKPSLDNSLPEDHKFIKALVQDNIYREAGSLEALQQTTGATHQRLFLGNWEYDDDPAKLIDYDTILNMFTNQFVKKGLHYITADIARFGDNKTVICIWEGWRCFKIITIDKSKITEAAEIIREYANKYKIPTSRIIVDEDGIGGGVVDILKCKGFVNNSKPKITNKKENYLNLKSQCYFKYAEKVNNNEVYIICGDEEIKEKIIEEHEYIKKDKIDKDGKVCILPKDKVKEQLGRSPDYSDAMMMRLWFDIGFQFSIK